MDDFAIIQETPFIEAVLVCCGVRGPDLSDMIQEVLIGAWKSMAAGRFRPQPDIPLREAIRAWLYGIAWRQASHYRHVAHRQHEIPVGHMSSFHDAEPLTENQVGARRLLEAIRLLPRKCQEILELVAVGMGIREAADKLGIPPGTANTRLRRGRRLFRRAIARSRR